MTLLTLSAAFVTGVFLGLQLGPPFGALGFFALAAVLLLLLLAKTRRATFPALLALLAVTGAVRGAPTEDRADDGLVAYHGPAALQVEGVVVDAPEVAGTVTRLRLAVDSVRAGGDWDSASGDVMVTLRETPELVRLREAPYLRYGDRLLLSGALSGPSELEGFDFPAYLARQGIGTVMSFPRVTLVTESEGNRISLWLHDGRRSVARSLAEVVAEPQASLGQALLLGLRDNMPDELVDSFRKTGTSHLLAISGLHVGILLGLSLGASQGLLGRRKQLYLAAPLAMIWLYAAMAGMSPSVARAAIMGSVFLAAMALGRPRSLLPALGLAGALMVALDPPVLLSVSFQLSFAAMAGIAVMAEPIGSWLMARLRGPEEDRGAGGPLLGFIAYSAAMTVSATVATLPLVAFYFEHLPLVGLPTTLLTLPALPLVLVAQAAAGVLGLFATWLALPFGWLAWAATAYVIEVVEVFARLPGASVETGRFGPALVWAYYGVIALSWYLARHASRARAWREVLWRTERQKAMARRVARLWVLLPAIAAAVIVWAAALSVPDGRLHVTFADVGQGDATLITTPSGKRVLVDGGPDPLEAARLMGRRLPFWDRSVDLVVLTQAHSDHAAGLVEVLRRYAWSGSWSGRSLTRARHTPPGDRPSTRRAPRSARRSRDSSSESATGC